MELIVLRLLLRLSLVRFLEQGSRFCRVLLFIIVVCRLAGRQLFVVRFLGHCKFRCLQSFGGSSHQLDDISISVRLSFGRTMSFLRLAEAGMRSQSGPCHQI